jgi:integrase
MLSRSKCFTHSEIAEKLGVTRSEVSQDIDIKGGIIHLYDTKNGTNREVYINDTVKRVLIKVRKHPESPYVFTRRDGRLRLPLTLYRS